jgi:glutamate synthase (NADPH/NADH) small chain
MEKWHIDRRVEQMELEGVEFRAGTYVGDKPLPASIANFGKRQVSPKKLLDDYDAVILSGGAEIPRDLPIPGRELAGVHFAMEFLPLQNKVNAGEKLKNQILATGKNVLVIGGGDTGSDCVGTSNRHGAKAVVQIELLPQPPEHENKELTWPYWPLKMRTSSSHEEGVERDWAITTKEFKAAIDEKTGKTNGCVRAVLAAKVEWKKDEKTGAMKMVEVPGSEFEIPADLVLFAMGFTGPVTAGLSDELGLAKDQRGNVKATTEGKGSYQTSNPKVFAAGDMRRGQSLVVWAIREGRQCARSVDEYLMGESVLPR